MSIDAATIKWRLREAGILAACWPDSASIPPGTFTVRRVPQADDEVTLTRHVPQGQQTRGLKRPPLQGDMSIMLTDRQWAILEEIADATAPPTA